MTRRRSSALVLIAALMLAVLAPTAAAPAAAPTAAPARAAAPADTLVFREVRVQGEAHRFAVWVPPGHDSTRAWPLVLFLHGSGECGRDGLAPTRVGIVPAARARPERWPCLIAVPQKPHTFEEWEEREALVLAVLDAVGREWHVDPDRVALTGMSQGGHGTWMIGARHAERFACLAPVCGYGRARTVAPRVAHLPVWAWHGLRDDVVDPKDTRLIVEGIRAERVTRGLDPDGVRMTLEPTANHNMWDGAYGSPDLPAWLLAQRRVTR
jgi:predicted peptidase